MGYHLIVNPVAGRGRGKKLESTICKVVETGLGKVEVYRTESPGHAQQIAIKLRQKNSIVIAAGGDGTINEIVNGLVGSHCTLGIIPIGSGNDFIKMLNLPGNIQKAVEVIRRQETMMIDIGRAGEKYFVNGLGIGFDAEVVIETMKIKKLRGFFIYLYSVLKALKNYKNRLINLDINGETISRKVLMISVGNGRCLGGGFYLTPNAKLDDGLFDICIFRAMNRIEILTNLPKALKGKHLNLPQVQCLQTGHLIAQAADGMPIHMDGELLSLNSKKITIEIVPKALNIIHNC